MRKPASFDTDRYRELLVEYLPRRVFKSEERTRRVRDIERLASSPEKTPALYALMELLALLVEAYDGKHLWPWWAPAQRAAHARTSTTGMRLEEFEIGKVFRMSGREWLCTDVGTRTACAVRYEEYLRACDLGPPYSVAESVIDEHDMRACSPSCPR